MDIHEKKEARFNSIVRQVAFGIQERMSKYIDAHYAGVGLFVANQEINKVTSRAQWRKFVETLNLLERYPGINGLGYAISVDYENLSSFEQSVKNTGLGDYKVIPLGKRENYFAIKFIEPIEINAPALGFDMGSEKRRRAALEKARDTGVTTISRKIFLVQDSKKTPGFLSYVPFYEDGIIPATIEEKLRKHKGWIYAPFITSNFIKGLFAIELNELEGSITLEIFDGKILDDEDMIYSNLESFSAEEVKNTIFKEVSIPLQGQVWTLRIGATKKIFASVDEQYPKTILFLGVLFSLLLFFLFQATVNTRDRALTLAAEMTSELNKKNEMLERSNEELDSFAYIASHDLKEPLRGIHNYARFLKEDYLEILDDAGKQKLNRLMELTQRLEALLDSLLHYSRIGQIEESFQLTSIKEVLEDVLNSIDSRLKEKNVLVEMPEKFPRLVCDSARIGEVFRNLITNAYKYNDKKEKVIEIGYKKDSDKFIFYVRDNGIGIQERFHDNIFDIFKRLHGKSEYDGGTGSGLTIAKKIINQHGGKMWLESEPTKGTVFYFSIPEIKE